MSLFAARFFVMLLLFTVGSFPALLAQVRGGFKAGLSVSKLHSRQYQFFGGASLLAGGQGGFFLQGKLSSRLLLQGEVVFSQTGWQTPGFAGGGSMRLHYVKYPLMIGYSPLPALTFLAGGEVNLLLSAHYHSKAYASPVRFTSSFPMLDYSLQGGVAIRLSSAIFLQIATRHSLQPIYDVHVEKSEQNAYQAKHYKDGYLQSVEVNLCFILPYAYAP